MTSEETGSRATCELGPFWDDEVVPLLLLA